MLRGAVQRSPTEETVRPFPIPFHAKTGANQLSLSPFVIARGLAVVAMCLVLASVAGQVSAFVFGHDSLKGFVRLFNVDSEQNVPTAFSVLLILAVALLLSVIAVLHRRQRTPFAWPWVVLSSGFLYMAYDEAFTVHENLGSPVRALLGDRIPTFINYAWVIPGAALVVVLALLFWRFLLQLPPATRRAFVMAASLYIGGALGGDLLFTGPYAAMYGEGNLTYSLLSTLEESLEMAGLIVFISALLKYGANTYQEVRFRINADDSKARIVTRKTLE
jgi:hypothetical protein